MNSKPKACTSAPLIELSLAGLSLGSSGASAVASAIKYNRRRIVIDTDMVDGGFSYMLAALLPTKWAEQVRPQPNITSSSSPRVVSLHVTSLDLSGTEIGNRGVAILTQVLESNTTVKTLLLERNKLEGTGAIAIASLLRVNRTLIDLSLDHNELGDGGMAAIAHSLGVSYGRALLTSSDCRAYEAQEICAGTEPSFDALQARSTLTRLSVQNNRIRHMGAAAIAILVRNRPSLTIMAFKNPLGDLGTDSYISALVARGMLFDLELQGCKLTQIGATRIASILASDGSRAVRRRRVDLSGNALGTGLASLCSALQVTHTVTHLALDRCVVSSSSIRMLVSALSTVDSTHTPLNIRSSQPHGAAVLQELRATRLQIVDPIAANTSASSARAMPQRASPQPQPQPHHSHSLPTLLRSGGDSEAKVSTTFQSENEMHRMAAGTAPSSRPVTNSPETDPNVAVHSASMASLCKCLGDLVVLQKVDFSGTSLHTLPIVYLSSAIGRNSSICSLAISDCSLCDEELSSLFVAIENNASCLLTSLDVSCNEIGLQSSLALGSMLAHNPSITHLMMNENPTCSEDGMVPEIAVQSIFDGLARNSTLTHLYMGHWALGDLNIAKVAGTLIENSTLACLDLRSSNCGDEGAVAIASALYSNISLTELRLETISATLLLSERGVASLARALAVNTSLCFISVSSSLPPSHPSVLALTRLCSGNRLLQPFLHVDLSRFVTRRDLNTPRSGHAIEALYLNHTSGSHCDAESPLGLSAGSVAASASSPLSRSTSADGESTEVELRWLSEVKVCMLLGALAAGSSYSLAVLDLSHNNLESLTAPELSQLTALRQLSLAHNRFTCRSLAHVISALPGLTALDASYNDLLESRSTTDGSRRSSASAATTRESTEVTAIRTLTKALAIHRSSWKALSLRRCFRSTEGVAIFASQLENVAGFRVTSLDLGALVLDSAAAVVVMRFLSQVSSLERVLLNESNLGSTSMFGVLQNATLSLGSITALDLTRAGLGCAGAVALASVLATNQCLQTLILSDNSIGFDGAVALSRSLYTNQSLTELCLSNNPIDILPALDLLSSSSSSSLSSPSSPLLSASPSPSPSPLRSPSRPDFSTLQLDSSYSPPHLEKLEQCSAIAVLADALAHNASLTKLSLRNVSMADLEARALANVLQHQNHTLQHLDLRNASLSVASINGFIDALGFNNSLVALPLYNYDQFSQQARWDLQIAIDWLCNSNLFLRELATTMLYPSARRLSSSYSMSLLSSSNSSHDDLLAPPSGSLGASNNTSGGSGAPRSRRVRSGSEIAMAAKEAKSQSRGSESSFSTFQERLAPPSDPSTGANASVSREEIEVAVPPGCKLTEHKLIRLVKLLTLDSLYDGVAPTRSLSTSSSTTIDVPIPVLQVSRGRQAPLLTALDLSSTKLTILPECICELTQLRKLNLANNSLRYLPYRMEEMTNLVELNLDNNASLIVPPPAVVERGVEAIRSFLKGIKEGDEFKRVKLVLLGNGGVGKRYRHALDIIDCGERERERAVMILTIKTRDTARFSLR